MTSATLAVSSEKTVEAYGSMTAGKRFQMPAQPPTQNCYGGHQTKARLPMTSLVAILKE